MLSYEKQIKSSYQALKNLLDTERNDGDIRISK